MLDRERHIFRSKERGTFVFNPETGEYTEASVDATLTLPKVVDRRKRELLILDFGDAFFLDKFITINLNP